MTHLTTKDFTAGGLRIEGPYENDRNAQNSKLWKAIMKEAYGADESICGHHLLYVQTEKRPDPDHPGNTYDFQIVQEIPSADALIFDTEVAKKIWGDKWQAILSILAVTPIDERDDLLAEFYYGRDCAKH